MTSLALRRPRFGGRRFGSCNLCNTGEASQTLQFHPPKASETLRWLWSIHWSVAPKRRPACFQGFTREAKPFHVVSCYGFLWRVVAAISVSCSSYWYGPTLEPHHCTAKNKAWEMQKGFWQRSRIPFSRCCLPLPPHQWETPSTRKLRSVSFVGSHERLTLKLDRVPWHHKVIDWSMIQLSMWSKTIIFQAPIASQLEHATSWCLAWSVLLFYPIATCCPVSILLLDMMSIVYSSQDVGRM